MSIDFKQIYAQIKSIGIHAPERKRAIEKSRAEVREIFSQYSNQLDAIHKQVEQIKNANLKIRYAYPLSDPLDMCYPEPTLITNITLIAADGSQVNPDRHATVQFCAINIGVVTLQVASGQAPKIDFYTQLLLDKDLFENGQLLNETTVALRRDLEERRKLLELSETQLGVVVTLTDGPLGLWESKDKQTSKSYEQKLKEYTEILKRLEKKGITTAGYVDKPGADLVIKLFEIIKYVDNKNLKDSIRQINETHPLQDVSDRWLYKGILKYGERSGVFRIQSEDPVDNSLLVNFFYLNTGSKNGPARVEIPNWVAEDKIKLEALHSVLMKQCRVLGNRPYPYILHRAHETAVITNDERTQIEQILEMELRNQGIDFSSMSDKKSAKINSRGRRKFTL